MQNRALACRNRWFASEIGRKEARMARKSEFKNKRAITIGAIAVAVLLLITLVLLLGRDVFFASEDTADKSVILNSDPYTYEYGAQMQFGLVGRKLAISSSTGLQILDKDGYALERQIYSAKNPALAASDSYCVFYDIGGTALRFYSDSKLINLDTAGAIIAASVSSSGHVAVASEELGYKGAVMVFDRTGEPAYKWYSGSGYVLDAAVSPNGNILAVLCLESSGGVVHLFELGKETEKATFYLPGELAFKLSFTANGSFCTLSETTARFFRVDGGELSQVDFGDLTLVDFDISESLCVLALGKYISGNAATLQSYSADGKLIGQNELDFAPLALFTNNQRLMALDSGSVTILTRSLEPASSAKLPAAFGSAVYLPDGDVLLLSSYHGEKISVR